jgi:antitoxin FitA
MAKIKIHKEGEKRLMKTWPNLSLSLYGASHWLPSDRPGIQLQRRVGRLAVWVQRNHLGSGEQKTLRRMISLISFFMAQLLVRDLEDAVVHALRQKAAEEGTSVEEAHRRILRLALLSKKSKKSFKEFLLEMPGGGDDSIFDRHRSQPREVLL